MFMEYTAKCAIKGHKKGNVLGSDQEYCLDCQAEKNETLIKIGGSSLTPIVGKQKKYCPYCGEKI